MDQPAPTHYSGRKAAPASRGFSLVELSITMVIVTLLLSGSVTILMNVQRSLKEKENATLLAQASEALIGFALMQNPPRLPCPDISPAGHGIEAEQSPRVRTCPSHEGWLPHTTLALPATDAWGRRIRYRVDPAFSDLATPLALSSVANLQVCRDSNCTALLGQALPAVLVSHGANGLGARSGDNVLLDGSTAGADEQANRDGRNASDTADTACPAACQFVSHEPREAGGEGGAFDDTISWVAAGTLFNRLVAAGRLP